MVENSMRYPQTKRQGDQEMLAEEKWEKSEDPNPPECFPIFPLHHHSPMTTKKIL